METKDIRVQKLRDLVEQAGGIAAFARQNNGVDPTYVSQLLNGHRSFGEKAARNMEQKVGLQYGYFDQLSSTDNSFCITQDRAEYTAQRKYHINNAGYVTFQKLNGKAEKKQDGELIEYPDVLQEISVLESWARQTLGTVDPSKVKFTTCKGDSMTPTVRPGDVVFVDASVKHFQSEGIYALVWENQLQLKRLIALFNGRLAIQSDNEANYKTEYVAFDQANQLTIHGKVLGWWTLKKNGA